jgi:hypothetical protein
MNASDPLYQLVVEIETRSAEYYKAAQDLRDLAKLILRVQGQPDLLRGMIGETRKKLDAYEALLPVEGVAPEMEVSHGDAI